MLQDFKFEPLTHIRIWRHSLSEHDFSLRPLFTNGNLPTSLIVPTLQLYYKRRMTGRAGAWTGWAGGRPALQEREENSSPHINSLNDAIGNGWGASRIRLCLAGPEPSIFQGGFTEAGIVLQAATAWHLTPIYYRFSRLFMAKCAYWMYYGVRILL